jgi:hypothetical protein
VGCAVLQQHYLCVHCSAVLCVDLVSDAACSAVCCNSIALSRLVCICCPGLICAACGLVIPSLLVEAGDWVREVRRCAL